MHANNKHSRRSPNQRPIHGDPYCQQPHNIHEHDQHDRRSSADSEDSLLLAPVIKIN